MEEMEEIQDGIDVDVDDGNVPVPEASGNDIPKVLLALAATLQRLVARNERCLPDSSYRKKVTIFHGVQPARISISKYLERIYKYTNCSPTCFIVGFVYIDRLVHKQPDLPLTSLNIHRLLVTSTMVATKLLEDVHHNNAFYARIGGISNAELNYLELDFLFRLDFRLQVTPNAFEGYCMYLERELLNAEQRVERTFPSFGNFFDEQVCLKDKDYENWQRKMLLFVNQNGPSVAADIIKDRLGPPSR